MSDDGSVKAWEFLVVLVFLGVPAAWLLWAVADGYESRSACERARCPGTLTPKMVGGSKYNAAQCLCVQVPQ